MKSIITVFMFIFSSIVLAQTAIDIEVAKIKNPDPNLVKALKILNFDLTNALNSYEGKKQFELMQRAIESSACIKTFNNELNKAEYKEVLNAMEDKFSNFDKLLKKYSADKKFDELLIKFNKKLAGLEQAKLCRFSISYQDSIGKTK